MNDMSPSRPAPVVRELAPDAQIVTRIPPETPWPDIFNNRSLVAIYPYFWGDGTKAMIISRYEKPDEKRSGEIKKSMCPYTLWQNTDGTAVWARKGIEGPQPVYNLPELLQRPKALVIISEGKNARMQ